MTTWYDMIYLLTAIGFCIFFFENHTVNQIILKNIVQQERPQMTTWYDMTYDMIYLLTAIGFCIFFFENHTVNQIILKKNTAGEATDDNMIWYDMTWYDMMYLLTAIVLSPGGSTNLYTTIHRRTQITTNVEECGRCPVFARWIPKATNTHSGCVILIAFPIQRWLHEHASMLRYTRCDQ